MKKLTKYVNIGERKRQIRMALTKVSKEIVYQKRPYPLMMLVRNLKRVKRISNQI